MKLNFLLLTALVSSTCVAQSAKDFFFPGSGKNVSVYSKPVMEGISNSNEKTLVYFKDMGDSAMITTVYPSHDGKIGWMEETVKIKGSQVSLVNVKSNVYKPQTFEEGEEILLNVPANGNGSSSVHVKGSTKQSYSAKFEMIKINRKKRKELKIGDKKRKALIITRSSEMKRSGKKLMSISDYYVQGIGYYKRTTDNGVLIEMLEDQKYDPNPPVLK